MLIANRRQRNLVLFAVTTSFLWIAYINSFGQSDFAPFANLWKPVQQEVSLDEVQGLLKYVDEARLNGRVNETVNELLYRNWNHITFEKLADCIRNKNCGPNQTKVILFGAHWVEQAVIRGWRGGEGVWFVSACLLRLK